LIKPALKLAFPAFLPYNPATRTDTLGGTAGLLFFDIEKLQFSEVRNDRSECQNNKLSPEKLYDFSDKRMLKIAI